MNSTLTATAQVTVHASPSTVWRALTTPKLIKKYLMGADVHTDWKVGSPLLYTGEYQGKPYEEKGFIKQIEPNKVLQATHYSASSGKEDKPENYSLVTWKLQEQAGETVVTVTQDGISSEKGVESSNANWAGVLKGLKETAESQA
jgi:uncharacterized protein YndB with AHSA1/START domain